MANWKYVYTESHLFRRVLIKAVIGVVLLLSGFATIIFFPICLNFILSWQLVFKEGNIFTRAICQKPSDRPGFPIKIHIWNLDNPKEFLRGAKPKMSERGPYVLLVSGSQKIISWSKDGMTVKLESEGSIKYDQKWNDLDINEKITMLNPITYLAVATTNNILNTIPFSGVFKPIIYTIMSGLFALHDERVIRVITIKELIEGKEMKLIESWNNYILKPIKWMGIDIPKLAMVEQILKDNKLGIIKVVNNAKGRPIELYTGQHNHSLFGRVRSLNGQRSWSFNGQPLWKYPKCNRINGILGIWYNTYMDKTDLINITTNGLGRSLTFSYKGYSLVKGSLQWRYWMGPSLYASPEKNRENYCYCTTPHDHQMCDGIYDIGYPYFRAPVALSHPHLLHSSNKLRFSVEGMEPNPNKHQTYIDVNPTLGFPVNGWVGVQLNLLVKPIPFYYGLGALPQSVYPVAWVEVEIKAPSLMLDLLIGFGLIGFMLLECYPYFAILIGLVFIIKTIRLVLKNKEHLIKVYSNSTPLKPFSSKVKNRIMSPKVFSISKGESDFVRPMPPGYDKTKPFNDHKNEKFKTDPRLGLLISKSIKSIKQRHITSPPGLIESL